MLAVIKSGGKQYLVFPGKKIRVEKLNQKEGSEVSFNEVLLLEKNKKIEIGFPRLKKVKVIGKVLREGRGEKVIIFKYRPKKRFKVKKGHRQPYSEVEILRIENK